MVADWIVIKSKVRDFTGEYSVSSDFSDVLNQKVKQMIADALKRAQANNRHTVMGRDL